MIYDCFVDMVGITLSECPCIIQGLTTEQQAALKVSTSGLYVDSIPDAIYLQTARDIDACKTLYDIVMDAKKDAIQIFQDAWIEAIAQGNFKKAAKKFIGSIGKPTYTGTLSDVRQFQGERWLTNDLVDGSVKITRIRLAGNTTDEEFLVKIARRIQGDMDFEILYSFPYESSDNNFVTVAIPSGGITLPLGVDRYPYEYRIYFDTGGINLFKPKDTEIGCNCDRDTREVLNSYMKIDGFSIGIEGADITGPDDYSHGFVIDVQVDCSSNTLLCRNYAENEAIFAGANRAVAYKTNEIIIEKVLNSPEINRFTFQQTPYLWGKRNHFRKEFDDRIVLIAGLTDMSESDCYVCSPKNMARTKILRW